MEGPWVCVTGRSFSAYDKETLSVVACMYIEKPLPFYMAYPVPYLFDGEQEQERDRQVMQSYYSSRAARIQKMVEEECDRLEYDGSMMFDEYPDKFMMEHLCAKIERKLEEEEAQEEQDARIMERGGVRDLIGVLLFDEMFRRRCRKRRCRRFF